MATYTFSFPPSAAGLSVVVRNADGDQVATATAGQPDFVQGAVVVTKDLDVGEYVAEATNAPTYYSAQADGVLDVPATISDLEGEAGGGLSAGDISATSPATWDAGNATIGVTVAPVATSGAYSDLTGTPSIPDSPDDIGAATSAQGALADSAVQPGDLSAVATSGAYGDLSGTPVAAHVDPATGTVEQVVNALVAAGLMAGA